MRIIKALVKKTKTDSLYTLEVIHTKVLNDPVAAEEAFGVTFTKNTVRRTLGSEH